MTKTESLRVRVGAVTLVLVTLAAIVFSFYNFHQSTVFQSPDDGVTWMDTLSGQGVVATHVAPNSAGERAGIKEGDRLLAINDVKIEHVKEVTQRLWRAGLYRDVRYDLARDGAEFTAPLVTAPMAKSSTDNFLRFVGVVYLFIGIFIFLRRWSAPRALHFYIFCLVSFTLYTFHYTGKYNAFDQAIYWANMGACLLQAALLMHFALVFPERSGSRRVRRAQLVAVYLVPAAIGILQLSVSLGLLGFLPWLGSRIVMDQIRMAYVGTYFLLAAAIF
ncbi:MAG TPA: PDZ domain-containing protein, partial [Candidatus Limnocylindrales bacterium]|nr:PDZ domain-containing protein [Candidatus Limnocylindrales bacterium]